MDITAFVTKYEFNLFCNLIHFSPVIYKAVIYKVVIAVHFENIQLLICISIFSVLLFFILFYQQWKIKIS